jgi:vacuolar-type H+-ATPase subunit E/Vma4
MRGKQPPTGGAESRNREGASPGGVAGPDLVSGSDLIAGIRGDAQAEAERLLAEARAAAEERVQAAATQAARILEEARAKAEAQGQSVEAQARSAVRMEDKRTSLKVREEALRQVLRAVRERLAALAGEQGGVRGSGGAGSGAADGRRSYRSVLLGWIVEAAIGLNVPEATVRVSAREQRYLDKELLQEAARRVKELTGREVTLEPAGGDPLVGQGVVLRSADGRLEFNNQVSTRLLRYQSEVRKIVFEALDR